MCMNRYKQNSLFSVYTHLWRLLIYSLNTHFWILAVAGKERKISEHSLENLKLGAQARYQGKERHNFTVLPETLEWLKKGGNASRRIDELVAAAKSGELKPIHTHDRKPENNLSSESVYKQIDELKSELEQVRQERDRLAQEVAANQVSQPQQPDLEAIRDRVLASLKLGKQAPGYKSAMKVLNDFISRLKQV